jgi:hypothetical protein
MTDELTPEQLAGLEAQKTKLADILRNYDPIDFNVCKSIASARYKQCGLEEPLYFFQARSPREAIAMAALLQTVDTSQPLYDRLMEAKRDIDPNTDPIWAEAWKSLRRQQEKAGYPDELDVRCRETPVDSETGLRAAMWKAIKEACDSSDWLGCSTDLGWLFYFDFFRKYRDVEYSQEENSRLDYGLSVVENCGGVLPYDKVAIIIDRPIWASVDMACEDLKQGDPILRYSDGYEILHGDN